MRQVTQRDVKSQIYVSYDSNRQLMQAPLIQKHNNSQTLDTYKDLHVGTVVEMILRNDTSNIVLTGYIWSPTTLTYTIAPYTHVTIIPSNYQRLVRRPRVFRNTLIACL